MGLYQWFPPMYMGLYQWFPPMYMGLYQWFPPCKQLYFYESILFLFQYFPFSLWAGMEMDKYEELIKRFLEFVMIFE